MARLGAPAGDTAGGFVVFVPGLAPGDHARVKVEQVWENRARARILRVLAPGPDRVAPPCPHFGDCGGCHWQHVGLTSQREAKTRVVHRFMEPLGIADRVAAIRGGQGYGYRNRLVLPLRGGRDGLRAGFFRAGTHDLVDINECAVQRPELWAVAREAAGLLAATGLPGWNERTGKGMLRHLLVRVAAGTGEAGVVVVTGAGEAPRLLEAARALMAKRPRVAGVARNVNPERTNVVLGPLTERLAGEEAVTEELAGVRVRSPLASFFQANAEVTELLAAQLAAWTTGETGGILDLFCGAGVLGLAAARGGVPAWIAGVESGEEAVAAARANAAGNMPGVPARYETGVVEDVLPRLGAELAGIGTVIVDPPRRGLSPAALAQVAALPARRLLYVSCDPATFARDLKGLLAAGWRAAEVVPFDMFPQTFHIELAARLEH